MIYVDIICSAVPLAFSIAKSWELFTGRVLCGDQLKQSDMIKFRVCAIRPENNEEPAAATGAAADAATNTNWRWHTPVILSEYVYSGKACIVCVWVQLMVDYCLQPGWNLYTLTHVVM